MDPIFLRKQRDYATRIVNDVTAISLRRGQCGSARGMSWALGGQRASLAMCSWPLCVFKNLRNGQPTNQMFSTS